MIASLIAAALLTVQDPVPPQASLADPVIRLEDVVVDGRRLEAAAEAFVDTIAAPVGRRGLARWHRGVCVGAVNLSPEIAQQLVDRVSDVARGLGLRAHEPPCHPSILIVATTQGSAFAEQFVAMRPVLFRPGGAGMNQGPAAFDRFVDSEAPVRWWTISQPTDSDTGQSAVRMPGQCNRSCNPIDGASTSVLDFAPNTAIRTVSRVSSQIRQDLKRSIVIVDVDKLDGVTLGQLGDYIAMVTLAQIAQDADTSGFDTILNIFESPDSAEGLTGWDRAYLDGLYGANWYRTSQNSQVHAISDAIAREYRDGQADEPVETPQ